VPLALEEPALERYVKPGRVGIIPVPVVPVAALEDERSDCPEWTGVLDKTSLDVLSALEVGPCDVVDETGTFGVEVEDRRLCEVERLGDPEGTAELDSPGLEVPLALEEGDGRGM
jgi:hypothetical protein